MVPRPLTVEGFLGIIDTQLLIRVLRQCTAPFAHAYGWKTDIEIYARFPSRENPIVCIYSRSYLETEDSERDLLSCEANPYFRYYTIGSRERSVGRSYEQGVEDLINEWKRNIPPWAFNASVVSVSNELDRPGSFYPIPVSGHRIMQNMRSMLTKLACYLRYVERPQPEKESLELVFTRLAAFIQARNKEWYRVVGDI